MPISAEQAVESLNEVARVQRRAWVLQGYQRGAPYFILWGMVWLVGYGVSDWRPALATPVWLLLDIIGLIGSLMLRRAAVAPGARAGYDSRIIVVTATVVAFISATYYVMKPHTAGQLGAFPALLMAAAYTLVGIWRGLRWVAAGVVLGALTVGGFAVFQQHFTLWMALAGSATLLPTGLWLRRP